ncbi:hypothetical protein GCM10023194_80810 [Planotetraspora phitsanulokensis]|uniref:Transcriptional regulator WhiB n=1 Tax=Planotetraspora phitsanulokensis TaxID=575192 RepID=A0A8J3UFP2_9ACTN|nr:WhiB family transcriptional regulator [Planotetraspora phitsanulokensis]GII42837.1 hypothetical protein Pph01_78400 [Planotetraspora phitsanulokensis]
MAISMAAIAWQDEAECKGQPLYLFYGPGEGEDRETAKQKERRIQEAKSFCGSCEVRAECLEYQFRFAGQYGVAGGLDEDERKLYRRRKLRSDLKKKKGKAS